MENGKFLIKSAEDLQMLVNYSANHATAGKTFTGTDEADNFNIAVNNAVINGGAGNDKFSVSGSNVTIAGGKGKDSIYGGGKVVFGNISAGDILNINGKSTMLAAKLSSKVFR